MYPECLPSQCKKVVRRLKGIIQGEPFVLAGGTALALQLGHRISVDLDFFTDRPFSTEKLFQKLEQSSLTLRVIEESQGTLNLLVNRVKVSFLYYPYPFLDRLMKWNGIFLAAPMDIAAMKVIAISQEGAKRDFVDLYFLLQDTPFRRVAEHMVQRYGRSRINPVAIGKALAYFRDAEDDPDPEYCGKERPGWEEIKKFFLRNLKQMVLDLENASRG